MQTYSGASTWPCVLVKKGLLTFQKVLQSVWLGGPKLHCSASYYLLLYLCKRKQRVSCCCKFLGMVLADIRSESC